MGLHSEGHSEWRGGKVTTVHRALLEAAGITPPAVSQSSWLGTLGTTGHAYCDLVTSRLGCRGVDPHAITAAQLIAIGISQL